MVHPCIPDWDEGGVELHACHSKSSTKTLCNKKRIAPDDIDQTAGAQQVCLDCYGDVNRTEVDNLINIR